MEYRLEFFATRDKKNTCELVLENPFKATVTVTSTNKNAIGFLRSRVLTYQSILFEEDGPQKDFECRIDDNCNLIITGNLKLFSIYLLQCDLISSDAQTDFVLEFSRQVQQSNLSVKERHQLEAYQANIEKAKRIINFQEAPAI